MLLGSEGTQKLRDAHVAVFGLGGVGSFVCEALARSGIGHFSLVDADTVAGSNMNRQLIATTETLGMRKTDAMKDRMSVIAPDAEVSVYPIFYGPETADQFCWDGLSYVVDAVDTVTAKLLIIQEALERGIPVISSMGTGNKLDPSKLEASDVFDTSVDPLARVMRRELRRRNVDRLQVVYSEEEVIEPLFEVSSALKARSPGSMIFVPGAAGLLLASVVVRDLAYARSTPSSGI